MAESDDIRYLLDKLYIKDNKRKRHTFAYIGIVFVLALALNYWLLMTTHEVQSLKVTVNAEQVQLARAREASDYIQKGVNLAHAKNFTGAIQAYNSAIELDPLNPVAFNLKGYLLFRRGQSNDAVRALRRSVQIEPGYVWSHYNLALALWAQGEESQAIAEVKKVLELDPSFSDVIQRDGQFKEFWESAEFRKLLGK